MKRLQRSKFAAFCSSASTSLLRMKATMRKTPSTKKTRLAMVLTILMMQKWGRSCRILPSSMKKLCKLGLICSRSITTFEDAIFYICQKYFSFCIIIFVRQISRVKKYDFWRWEALQFLMEATMLAPCSVLFVALVLYYSVLFAQQGICRRVAFQAIHTGRKAAAVLTQCHSKEIYKIAWAKILFACIKLKTFNSLSSRTLFELQKNCQEWPDLLFFTRPCSHAVNGPTNWKLRLFNDFLSEL